MRNNKYLSYQILASTLHGIYKKSYKSNKFKISVPIWNDKFELIIGSFSVSDVQDNFEYIIKKHETVIDNLRLIIKFFIYGYFMC